MYFVHLMAPVLALIGIGVLAGWVHRARLRRDADGINRVAVHPSRSSGVLSSVTWANGLVEIAEETVDFFAEMVWDSADPAQWGERAAPPAYTPPFRAGASEPP